MDSNQPIDILNFLAGLGLFLYAILLTESALKFLAGRSFKQIIRKHTNNHFKSIIIGIFSTAILQSSSAVTLILLAFVGSGVIVFSNALGIIIGANLGTTVTGWIISTFGFEFDIENYVLPIIAFGSLVVVFFKTKKRVYTFGKLILGFGLLFFGLSIMKDSALNFQSVFDPTLLKKSSIFIYFLGGLFFTAIIQSSSATMVITLTALNAGIIALDSSAALIIGADLGTTITVMLGTVNASYAKKRVAAAHLIFNLVTDVIALLALPLLLSLCLNLIGPGKPTFTLVLFHSSFNILGIIIFLPFLKKFASLIEKYIGKGEQPKPFHDIDPINLDASLEILQAEVKKQVYNTINLNLSITYPQKGLLASDDFLNTYEGIKENEAAITNYALKIQEGFLDQDQVIKIKRIILGIRNCSMAAKSLKDIYHNFESFRMTDNDYVFEIYQKVLDNLKTVHLSIQNNISKENNRSLFENLAMILTLALKGYQDFIKEMQKNITHDRIPLKEIPNLFNSNREVLSSNRLLVIAAGDIWLNNQQADDLENIPQVRF